MQTARRAILAPPQPPSSRLGTTRLEELHAECIDDATAWAMGFAFQTRPGSIVVRRRSKVVGAWTQEGRHLVWRSPSRADCHAISVEQAMNHMIHVFLSVVSEDAASRSARRRDRAL